MNESLTIAQARHQIRLMARSLQREFVSREEAVDMLVLSAIASEPILFVGPPGSGKTSLLKTFSRRLGVPSSEIFDYLITKFSEPSELLGPIDIHALRDGRYIRRTEGKLPTAKIVFLDEIFKANSSILNTLLSVLNERVFYQDGQAEPVHLEVFVAASNRIAEGEEFQALRDRFLLKVALDEVKDQHFQDLIRKGLMKDLRKQSFHSESMISLDIFAKVRKHLDEGLLTCFEQDRDDPLFSSSMRRLFERLVLSLDNEGYTRLSDRAVIKLYRLIRFHAFLMGRGDVQHEDLFLLSYTANHQEHFHSLRQRVAALLNIE